MKLDPKFEKKLTILTLVTAPFAGLTASMIGIFCWQYSNDKSDYTYGFVTIMFCEWLIFRMILNHLRVKHYEKKKTDS